MYATETEAEMVQVVDDISGIVVEFGLLEVYPDIPAKLRALAKIKTAVIRAIDLGIDGLVADSTAKKS